MAKQFKIGVVGFGRMGRGFVAALIAHPMWEVAAVCDTDALALADAKQLVPGAKLVTDVEEIFRDKSIEVVGLFTLADARPELVLRALKTGKQVIAEKPLAEDAKTEWKLVKEIEKCEASGCLVAVNMFNRNAWYHKEIQEYIAEGEIGELGIIRVCHMTPGHMPSEGHEPEGPPFHDCGMHYVDVARWYAKSEYKTWHAQGLRMWDYKDPWWVQCHGTFDNGVVFDITQGFVYGQLAKDKTHNCYVDCIGSKGIARMTHDFKNATIEVHGVTKTVRKTAPFNDKKLDVMVDLFAKSLKAGKNLGVPTARDSVIASDVAWAMLADAMKHDLPAKGTAKEMEEILDQRRNMRSGYGLPARHTEKTLAALGRREEARACGEDLCQSTPTGGGKKGNGSMQG